MSEGRVSIRQQIQELQREVLLRERLYPGFVARGRMRQVHADYYLSRLRAALKTLEWVMDNEALLKAAVAAVQRVPRQEERDEAA